MRKLFAFIVLIPIAVLFIGSVNIGAVCPPTARAACTQSPRQCCGQKNGACAKAKTRHPATRKQGREADRSACCFDCPLCALITIPPQIRFQLIPPQFTIEYAVSPDNRIAGYNQPHWKPPDLARPA